MFENFSFQLIAAVYNQLLMKRLDGFDTVDIAAYVYAYVIYQFYEKEESVLLNEILDCIFSKTELSEVDSERFQQSAVLRWLLVTDLFNQPNFLQPMLTLLLTQWEQPISPDILNRKNKHGQTFLMRLCETGSEAENAKVMAQTLLRRDDIEFIDVLFSNYFYELISYLPEPKTDNLISLFCKSWLSIENGSAGLPELFESERWLCELCYAYGLEEAYTVKNQAFHRFVSLIIEQSDYRSLYGLDLTRLRELEREFDEISKNEKGSQLLIGDVGALFNEAYELYCKPQYIETFNQLFAEIEMIYFKHIQKQRLQASLIHASAEGQLERVEALMTTAHDLGIVLDSSLSSSTSALSLSETSEGEKPVLKDSPIIMNDLAVEPSRFRHVTFSVRIRVEVFLSTFISNVVNLNPFKPAVVLNTVSNILSVKNTKLSDADFWSIYTDVVNRFELEVDSVNEDGMTLLTAIFQSGRENIIKRVMAEQYPQVIDAWIKNNGVEALVMASALGHTEVVKILLRRRVNVNARNKAGDTALMAACKHSQESDKHLQVVNFLLTLEDIEITRDIFRKENFKNFTLCLSDHKLESLMKLSSQCWKGFQEGVFDSHPKMNYKAYFNIWLEVCRAYLFDRENKERNLALNRYFSRVVHEVCDGSEPLVVDFKRLMGIEKFLQDVIEANTESPQMMMEFKALLNSAFKAFLSNKPEAVFKEILAQLEFIEQHMLNKSPYSAQDRKKMLDNIKREVKEAIKVEGSSVTNENAGTLNVPQALFFGDLSGQQRGAYAEGPKCANV